MLCCLVTIIWDSPICLLTNEYYIHDLQKKKIHDLRRSKAKLQGVTLHCIEAWYLWKFKLNLLWNDFLWQEENRDFNVYCPFSVLCHQKISQVTVQKLGVIIMDWRPATSLERDSSTGFYHWILQNFLEQFFGAHLRINA